MPAAACNTVLIFGKIKLQEKRRIRLRKTVTKKTRAMAALSNNGWLNTRQPIITPN